MDLAPIIPEPNPLKIETLTLGLVQIWQGKCYWQVGIIFPGTHTDIEEGATHLESISSVGFDGFLSFDCLALRI